MKRYTGRLLILFAVGLWLLGVGSMYFRSRKEHSAGSESPNVGRTSPDFELQNLSGQNIRLEDFRGHPVLINFWATWCGYCIDEMPFIEKYYELYGSDLKVLTVEVGDTLVNVRTLVEKHKYTFPVLWDPDSSVFNRYRLNSFPVTFILDAKGTILVKHQGYMSEEKLVVYLSELGLNK